jgi:hypothetical protein
LLHAIVRSNARAQKSAVEQLELGEGDTQPVWRARITSTAGSQ